MTRIACTAPAIAALVVGAGAAFAAPSLPVTKPPVVGPLTGPAIDPAADFGQWFIDPTGLEEVRSHEFHDNVLGFGGGFASHRAIEGVILTASDIIAGPVGVTGFFMNISITNDTSTWEGPFLDGFNSHQEFRPTVEPYVGKLFDTKMTIEFADDGIRGNFMPDAAGTGPESNIFAVEPDQFAWFSFTDTGGYQVPTYDFGHIPVGETVTRRIEFGLYDPVPLVDFLANLPLGQDLLLNRTTSLKISNYFERDPFGLFGLPPYFDTGEPYPDFGAELSSNVSVFHNIPAPAPLALVGLAGVATLRRRAR